MSPLTFDVPLYSNVPDALPGVSIQKDQVGNFTYLDSSVLPNKVQHCGGIDCRGLQRLQWRQACRQAILLCLV